MSLVSDLLLSVNEKLDKIGQLLSDVVNVNVIKAERDEAIAGIQAIDDKAAGIIATAEKPIEQPAE